MTLDFFHFLEPLWLLALIPLVALLWLSSYSSSTSNAWAKVIDPKLLPLLLQGEDKQTGKLAKWLLGIGWLITIIALADPVWEKIPRPVFQTNTARVIVLDLSNSMLVDDLTPSRTSRARFKIEDILSKDEEGQTGLVVFAGDAFTVSPLTRDSDTIRSLLQVLTPQIMPKQGSRVDLGLKKAHELLKQAGVDNGQVLLIADGVSKQTLAIQMAKALERDGHIISVLGVGTEMGGKLKFRSGKSVSIKLATTSLREIAYQGSGRYHQITSNDADLKAVVPEKTATNKQQTKTDDLKSYDWKSTGPFIIFLLLPLAALAFRKGWLFSIFISASLVGILTLPQPAMAQTLPEKLSETWDGLWKTKEQQASKALQNKQYDKASELAKDPLRRGSAQYKKGDYQKALEDFEKIEGADARYNEGNTLVRLEKYEEAIKAYDEALKHQPKMEDAEKNKTLIQDLLKKKQKQESEKGDNKQDKKEGEPGEEGSGGEGEEGDGEKGQEGEGEKGEGEDKENKEEGKDNAKDQKSKNQFSDANKQLNKKPENPEDAKQKDGDENKQEAHKGDSQKGKAEQEKSSKKDKTKEKGTKVEAEELNDEEKMAAEQWLRRIPDDPGGLLRRKFKRQYQQRNRDQNNTENPW